MKSMVKMITNCIIVVSVIALIVGVVLMSYPFESVEVFGVILGVYWIVQGISLIVLDVKARKKHVPFNGLLPGILGVLLGVLMMYNQAKVPGFMEAFIGISLGIWIIMNAFSNISFALSLRGSGAPVALLVLINIISICLGGMILYSPIAGALSYVYATGIVLIVESIITIIYMIIVKKNSKDLEKVIEQAVKEVDEKALEVLKKADEAAAAATNPPVVAEEAPQAEPAEPAEETKQD